MQLARRRVGSGLQLGARGRPRPQQRRALRGHDQAPARGRHPRSVLDHRARNHVAGVDRSAQRARPSRGRGAHRRGARRSHGRVVVHPPGWRPPLHPDRREPTDSARWSAGDRFARASGLTAGGRAATRTAIEVHCAGSAAVLGEGQPPAHRCERHRAAHRRVARRLRAARQCGCSCSGRELRPSHARAAARHCPGSLARPGRSV
mmetsp:Transcript_32956/g.98359  ORF Transcript_32956/g.98359 Transcript_32956/m.98359 type:complete len:205 (+) Transcript_32956:417-1031(+)